jgi:ABC-2 type transport system permease protein
MLIGYSAYAHQSVITYPVWVILSLFLPVIPMLIAAFLGFLIARISAGFRKTNIIQTVLMMAFVIFCFSLRFIIESVFKNDKVEATLERTSEITSNAAGIYLPAKWFSDAVTGNSVIAMLLLIGVSVLLFTAVFHVVGNSYRRINSALQSHAASKKYKLSGQKKRSVVNSIAFKEYKRLVGSSAYTVNGAMGEILAILLGLITLVLGFDRIVQVVTNDAPFDHAMLQPAIPFLVYFFIGMVATTAMSPSLEGRNYWIVQSLPIERKTLYQGKMLFNLYLTVPAMTFATLCMCISAKVPIVDTVLYLILGLALCAFSTTWGCVCGVKHMRLDWENEIEAIKQGAAVALYMLPNMFVVMGLVVLVVILGLRMDHRLLALAFILLATLLAALSYLRVMSLAKRK